MKKFLLLCVLASLAFSCVNKENLNQSSPSTKINEIQSGANSVLKDLDE